VPLIVDGVEVDLGRALQYKGIMFDGVPNLAFTFGYTNASWTLKADLTADYASRLFAYMDRHGYASATPAADADVETKPFLDFSSGYVRRAVEMMPKQGAKAPWRLAQNYVVDLLRLRYGRVADGTLKFTRVPARDGQSAPRISMRTI